MNWNIFLTTFMTIFIAEIGDKTQFAAFAVASQTRSTFTVLLATVSALAIAGSLGVVGGALLGRFIDPMKMKYISGSAFILMGFWVLFKRA